MKNILNIVGFIIQKVRKRTAEKIYAAFLYNKKISEITKEDIQKIFDEITARKHYSHLQ
ncbi:hypothetical protein [Orientia tsutsugamushi]|uniref:Putative integrase n=1 Tax=Orientia tsutsugamushi str. TA716 TaxID=1359175 RepID=A0A0F3P956_ORITS|nr:hypothetical protein [Orientia tsutsugamushi]KJV76865.1 putative integrase [Orientia tsutsugamushi str. TA716]